MPESAKHRDRPPANEAIWRAIRERKTFTVKEIARASGHPTRTASAYCRVLRHAGFLTSDGETCVLVRDQPTAPRLRRDGSPAAETGRGQDQMWRSMKMLSDFDVRDLAVCASTDEVTVPVTTAVAFVRALYNAGYLIRVKSASKYSGRARYRLKPSRNTGPRAPVIGRGVVIDPNTTLSHRRDGVPQ